jgi:hypothetical protein
LMLLLFEFVSFSSHFGMIMINLFIFHVLLTLISVFFFFGGVLSCLFGKDSNLL